MNRVIFATGTVSAIDERTVRARVRLPDHDNLRTAWLDVLQRNTQNNKDYWLPDIGEQVKVLLDANGDDGIILGAVYSDKDKPVIADLNKRRIDFADGAFMEYDRKNSTMTIGGEIKTLLIQTHSDITVETQTHAIVIAKKSATIDTPETVITGNATIKGDATVLGMLTYKGGMSGSGGKGAAATIQGDVKATGDIQSASVSLESHQHPNGHNGSPTGQPMK